MSEWRYVQHGISVESQDKCLCCVCEKYSLEKAYNMWICDVYTVQHLWIAICVHIHKQVQIYAWKCRCNECIISNYQISANTDTHKNTEFPDVDSKSCVTASGSSTAPVLEDSTSGQRQCWPTLLLLTDSIYWFHIVKEGFSSLKIFPKILGDFPPPPPSQKS